MYSRLWVIGGRRGDIYGQGSVKLSFEESSVWDILICICLSVRDCLVFGFSSGQAVICAESSAGSR